MDKHEFEQRLTQITSAALGRMAGIPVVHLAPLRLLINEATPLVRQAMPTLNEVAASDTSWSSIPLKEHRRLKLGLLRLKADARIPIHDHPCNISVMVVLDGNAVVELFDRGEKRPRRRTVPMKRKARMVLDPGARSEISPSGPNLHGISSETGALILTATYSTDGTWNRHWYLPVSDEGTHINALILSDPIQARSYPDQRGGNNRGRPKEPAAGQGSRRRGSQRKRKLGGRLST